MLRIHFQIHGRNKKYKFQVTIHFMKYILTYVYKKTYNTVYSHPFLNVCVVYVLPIRSVLIFNFVQSEYRRKNWFESKLDDIRQPFAWYDVVLAMMVFIVVSAPTTRWQQIVRR